MVNEAFDCLVTFEQAFKNAGFAVDCVRVPNFWISDLDRSRLRNIRRIIGQKKSEGQFVIFSPQSTELFLDEPDLILAYSGYRSWFDPKRMRVIPHLWTPTKPPKSKERIVWTKKPALRVGFMGRVYTNSKIANLISKLPSGLKQKMLEGKYLQHPYGLAILNEAGLSLTSLNLFSRLETIKLLAALHVNYQTVELEIVEKDGFSGADQELTEYENHLDRNTYILCPRGSENYSFRIYEAVNRGRVPVIIDTDMVLPGEIDWESVSLRVPYRSLSSIYDIIVRDFESRSTDEFVVRQQRALASMEKLKTMRWVNGFVDEVAQRFI